MWLRERRLVVKFSNLQTENEIRLTTGEPESLNAMQQVIDLVRKLGKELPILTDRASEVEVESDTEELTHLVVE
jgi:hypothetical protein